MTSVKSHKTIPDSQLCINGKTLSKMREIAEGIFMDSFNNIIVAKNRQSFVVFVEKNVPVRTLTFFKEKYKQCSIKFCEDA
jgi:hypothetical protein